MGKVSYINSPEADFSLGIDARSAENQIAPGFVQDLLNADIVEKRVRKRRGYQGYAGNLPFRAVRMEYKDAENQVCFTLDSAISLDTVRSAPLVVYGRSSLFTSGGPFTDVDAVKYYSGFSVPLRKVFLAPSGTLTVLGTEHGLESADLFASVLESSSSSDRSYQHIEQDGISINTTTFDVSIAYTTYIDRNVFTIFADKSTVTGSSYVHTQTVGTGTQSMSISAMTHSLSNFNIISQVYQLSGGSRIQVQPDSFLVDSSGNVTVDVTNGTGSSQTYYVILSAGAISNVVTGSVGADATGTVQISGLTVPWLFYNIYLEQTPGGVKELVQADTVAYDDTTGLATLTFTNLSSVPRNFITYYEYGDIRSNQLCVSDTTVTTDGTDDRPQITIWGLDHSEVYPTKVDREGWTTHLDSYRRNGEQRLVSGLGGNLFDARTYLEVSAQYLLTQLFPSLSARTATPRVLGPLFWDTAETPARSRGYITSDSSGTNNATVTSVVYNVGTGFTEYTLSLPNMAILDSAGLPTSLSAVLSTATDLEDYLTVSGMSYARHSGVFRIRTATSGVDEIVLAVENDSVTTTDWDDTGCAGIAGVFTDQITWTATPSFIPGDALVSDSLVNFLCTIISPSDSVVSVIDGVVDILQVAAGVLFVGQRTSSVIPLREPYPSAVNTVENVVRGDILSYTGIARQLRVLYINADTSRPLTITVLDGTATAVLSSGDTSYLSIGQSVALVGGIHSGIVEITDIPSLSSFEFATDRSTSSSSTLVGNTIQVDEDLSWEDTAGDTVALTVEARWIPIEAPDDEYDLTPNTYIRHLDTDSPDIQKFLRSTMVVDTLYATNGRDEVQKFDGTSIYRSGIIPWQAGLLLTQDTAGATIVTSLRSISYSAISAGEGKLTITAATSQVIPVGTNVRLAGSSKTYTINSYVDDGTVFYVNMDRALDSDVSATGTVAEIGTYRYYHRLNAVDANNNIIASAVTGYQDHVMELTGNAAILHKVIGLPAWDNYDYDRLEVEIYRTKINQAAPFYKITTLRMSFNNTNGYLTYRDSYSDIDISELDVVNTALKGAELGTSWSDPLRAKYITSIGNKLVLANVRDYPQLDLQIIAPASISDADFAGDSLLFRRDNTDTGTSTDMQNRVRYEWVSGFTGDVSAPSVSADQLMLTTSVATGAVPGDWIYLTYSTVALTGRDLTYCGWYQIATCTTTSITINVVGAGAATSYPDKYVIATDPTDVPVLLGVDGSLGMVNGDSFDLFDAMRRMSMAINSSQRMVDVTISGMELYTPWLTARGGNDVSRAGRLIVRQPRSDATTMEVVPTFSGYDLFVNSVSRDTGDSISASTRIYPSRLLASYENYPEIFDNPTSILDTDSDSAIDVNSADGQEITGVIPFFGEAAFTAAQQSAILVVFKSNSIYLVDLNQKASGLNAVQRIESEGLGCTAPYSIAVTKKGVVFANESGIYCLRRDQSIQYIGKFMERKWTERVDLNMLETAHGHHYGIGRAYKLSIPLMETEQSTGYNEPSEVYVYNHTGEDEGKALLGAWSRYDNHAAIGWANLGANAYYASTAGRIYILRNTNRLQDFRDDNSGVDMVFQARANDFGNAGIRKVIDSIVIHYRVGATSTGTSVGYSLDLEQEYSETNPVVISKASVSNGTSDVVARNIASIRHAISRRRGVYISIQIANGTIDESVEIAGIDYRVGGLTDHGMTEAADT